MSHTTENNHGSLIGLADDPHPQYAHPHGAGDVQGGDDHQFFLTDGFIDHPHYPLVHDPTSMFIDGNITAGGNISNDGTFATGSDIQFKTDKLDGLTEIVKPKTPISLAETLADIYKKLNSIEARLTRMEFAPPNGTEFQAIMSDYDDIKKSLTQPSAQ